jgi:hypothetical protein
VRHHRLDRERLGLGELEQADTHKKQDQSVAEYAAAKKLKSAGADREAVGDSRSFDCADHQGLSSWVNAGGVRVECIACQRTRFQ